MRIIVFFDLPTTTSAERKVYANFRKNLIKDGFAMMQYSVYSKLVLNYSGAQATKDKITKYKPKQGSVQLLTITEKQFARIDNITGGLDGNTIQSTDRTIVI